MERQYGAITDSQVLEEILLDSKNCEAVPRLRAHAVPALAQLLDERNRGPMIGEADLTLLTALRCVRNLSAAGELLGKALAVHSIPQLMCSILRKLLENGLGANDQHQLLWCVCAEYILCMCAELSAPFQKCAPLRSCAGTDGALAVKVALQALANLSTGSPAAATAIWHNLFPDLFMSSLSLHPGSKLTQLQYVCRAAWGCVWITAGDSATVILSCAGYSAPRLGGGHHLSRRAGFA